MTDTFLSSHIWFYHTARAYRDHSVWLLYSVCCADCIALSTSFVCMSRNILHYSSLSKNRRCCVISTKSQRHTARILWARLEKCWYIIVGITISCSSHRSNRLRYIVSGPRCCFSTIKLSISGMFASFFLRDSRDGLFFCVSCVTPHSHAPLSSFVLTSANKARGGTRIHAHPIWIPNKLLLRFWTPKALKTKLQEDGLLTQKQTKILCRCRRKITERMQAYDPFTPWRAKNGGCHSE